MPRVTGILETSLYVDDLPRAVAFYESLFGFAVMVRDARICAMNVRPGQVLLIFQRGASLSEEQFPTHDGHGPLHLAFSIAKEDVPAWEARLAALSIAIEARKHWDRGGDSLYFRDPDNHLIELATPGVWANF